MTAVFKSLRKCPWPFPIVRLNYPSIVGDPAKSRRDFYQTWGWENYSDIEAYKYTCATRLSICLLKCFPILEWKTNKGAWVIKKAPTAYRHLVGKKAVFRVGGPPLHNPGIVDVLAQQWGAPEEFGDLEKAKWGKRRVSNVVGRSGSGKHPGVPPDALKKRKGIIAYYGISCGMGFSAHVGIISVDAAGKADSHDSYGYFGCDYVLFWPCADSP